MLTESIKYPVKAEYEEARDRVRQSGLSLPTAAKWKAVLAGLPISIQCWVWLD